MRFKPFKTDTRLWLLISSFLFILTWFLECTDQEHGSFRPIILFGELFTRSDKFGSTLTEILCFAFFFGVPAFIPVAWIIQWVIVMIRDRNVRGETDT
jgi:hypothetical protein